ncbi:serine hydrolase domain-containing protein [Phyllobacterium myrsinacearum]|uniref:Serine hydrolase n=1 Tax=Phyllobacterium myrsinacearum TaxID=28101 RepID=A0A2S9JB61_9HYPH|nr:serine hydrolase domain-containing protein [Phyllobacterium myrsinacearum]PRD50044.1 serine hydrolase [Phyllobacterium myrsinacearum]PWV90918.1 CubicO group peptidase (beta-lactamase class C family) [Phyllobacterium myrsinacearum]RZU97319.1 CubicO group peptidase (beta-lactamase class C family) [Phyllobacterium myrsinacearum]
MRNIDGVVENGWELVADTFRANFREGKDLGAACCVYVDGRAVVDLWGGLADRAKKRPWERDTVVAVASTTKGATAMCAHLLAERGQLDLDAPVIRYWPEFGAAGKEEIPVRYLLSHHAGLAYVDTTVTFEEACAWEPFIRALEAQKPLWTPGTEHLYHAVTYGFLVGEVVRRITGRSLGTFFAEEIAGPLGLSAWIGLPEEIETRLALIEAAPFPYNSMEDLVADFAKLMRLDPAVAAALVKDVYGPGSAFMKAGAAGGLTEENVQSRTYRAAEFPAANMFTNARSLARMYAATVSAVDGARLLQPDTVAAMSVVQTDRTRMHGVPAELLPYTKNLFRMSLGFWRATPPIHALLGPASFGHPGSGGSLGAADPEARVGFGYVTNLWAAALVDPRAIGLTAAVRKCLG